MEKVKKSISFAILLSVLLTLGLVHMTFALHTANVYWIGATEPYFIKTKDFDNDTLVLRSWTWTDAPNNQISVTFQVNKTSLSDIVRVQVHIYEENNRAFFHFLKGDADVGWETRILEKDGYGWARLIEFYATTDNYRLNKTRNFTVTFGNISGSIRPIYYPFAVTTIDKEGGSVEHTIYLMFDTLPPIIQTQPADGDVVHGILVPCGRHYFILNVTVFDDPSADTGISKVFITIDNNLIYSNQSMGIKPGKKWVLPPPNNTIWNLASGSHILNVTAFDGVGNRQSIIVHFNYIPPPGPRVIINPTSGYSAPKSWYDSASKMLKSEQKIYKTKVLGTKVTITGENFEANAKVTITVTLPYGEYIVNITTVKPDNTFETWFIFPVAPMGNYTIKVYSKPCNLTTAFDVLPEIIYEPDEVIGPALINVEATGFIKPDIIPETGKISILCNNTDALQGVNLQAMFNWYIDGNGTLKNMITIVSGRITECGLFLPALQPGTYNIALLLATTGSYWNFDHWKSITNCEHTNKITVKDWTGDILDAANAAKTAAEGAKSSADAAKSSADAAKSSADAAKSSADAAKSSADAAKSSADSAKSSADAAKSSADAAKSSADSAAAGIDDAKTSAENAKNAAQGLTVPVYLAVIFSLIAAIIAAACAVLVYRKIA
jgi:hypothetical protein